MRENKRDGQRMGREGERKREGEGWVDVARVKDAARLLSTITLYLTYSIRHKTVEQ